MSKITKVLSQKKVIAVGLVVLILLVGSIWWYMNKSTELPTNQPIAPDQNNISEGFKLYRNEEWGFEFQYPEDLILKENLFKNYYSKFNLEVSIKTDETHLAPVFDVNVVLSEFVESSFKNLEKTTSSVSVDGIVGVRYDYIFEGLPEIAIILPLGQNKIILGMLGTIKPNAYENIFNQILSTFKFLK